MHANNGSSHRPTFDYEEIIFSNPEPDEEDISSNALIAFAQRLTKHFGVKVVTQPVLEEEDDECEFDLRVTDVPEDVLRATNTEPDLLEVRLATFGKSVWQRTRHKRLFARLLLLALLVLLVSISAFGHTLLNLFPLSSPTPATSFTRGGTFNIPVHTTEPNVITFKSNNEVTVTARNVPHYCPASVMLGKDDRSAIFQYG